MGKNFLHKLFRISILLKGLDGLLELAGAAILFTMSSQWISQLVQALFRHELGQDPADLVAGLLIHASANISVSTQLFVAVYLFVHGAVKVGLVAGLWLNKLWAYPVAGVILSIFIIYQSIRFFSNHSIVLLGLTLFDILIVVLLRFEYKRLQGVA
ncbi:MAG: DUF2127 domain-containing protein [Candidatus Woesearchaeota archaeon]